MKYKVKKRFVAFLATFCMVFSMTATAFAAGPDAATNSEPVVIGRYDGLLSDCLLSDTPMPRAVANVRINSYATYDSDDGIQIKVKLYVPALEFPKPEFTSMTGNVTVSLNSRTTNTSFGAFANGDSTIESDVNTGRTGNTGDNGTVSVSGVATANNAIANGGIFAISYPVTIP